MGQQTQNVNQAQGSSKNQEIIKNPDADLKTLVKQIRDAEGDHIAVVDARETSESKHWIKNLKTDEKGDTIVPGVDVTIVEAEKPFAPAVYIVEPSAKPVSADKSGSVWGDPHFVGFDGSKFDFQGHNGGKYVLLKDGEFEINALFNSWNNGAATVITHTVTTINGHKIEFAASGPPKIDGKVVSSQSEIDQILGNGSVNWDGNNLHVIGNNGEYAMSIKRHDGYIDVEGKIGKDGVLSDGEAPTGILGQTAIDGKDAPNENFEIKDLYAGYQQFESNERDRNKILRF